MKMGIFSSRGPSLHGWLIRAVTGKWNHSGVVFVSDQPGDPTPVYGNKLAGHEFYFESYWKKDPVTGRDGVRGPVPWLDMIDWMLKDHKQNITTVQWLPYSPELVLLAYWYCMHQVGKVCYAHTQLWMNAKRFLLGLGQASWQTTGARKVTCSEFAARTWDYIDPGRPGLPSPLRKHLGVGDYRLFDDVAPSGRSGGLWEAIDAWLQTL